jgi:dephospho-CoA kinase
MFKLGLTGSIATGKSTVLKMFEDLGVPVSSADTIVHELYRGEAVEPIRRLAPDSVKDGVVQRVSLNESLRRDPELLARVESVVHPMVRKRNARFLADAEKAGAPLAVLDVPLLFETGFDYGLDAVAVTLCSEATQRQRVLARPGMTVEKLERILARQMPQAEKRARATYVFDTDQPLERTRLMVVALVEAIKARSKPA